jgi:hypothetical protein
MKSRSVPAAFSRYFDHGIQFAMRNAILELFILLAAIVLWTFLAVPGLSAHGMNWLSVLFFVVITAESTRLCVTGRPFFSRSEPVLRSSSTDANRNAAQDQAALRKVS